MPLWGAVAFMLLVKRMRSTTCVGVVGQELVEYSTTQLFLGGEKLLGAMLCSPTLNVGRLVFDVQNEPKFDAWIRDCGQRVSGNALVSCGKPHLAPGFGLGCDMTVRCADSALQPLGVPPAET
jgi:hypothetical protein